MVATEPPTWASRVVKFIYAFFAVICVAAIIALCILRVPLSQLLVYNTVLALPDFPAFPTVAICNWNGGKAPESVTNADDLIAFDMSHGCERYLYNFNTQKSAFHFPCSAPEVNVFWYSSWNCSVYNLWKLPQEATALDMADTNLTTQLRMAVRLEENEHYIVVFFEGTHNASIIDALRANPGTNISNGMHASPSGLGNPYHLHFDANRSQRFHTVLRRIVWEYYKVPHFGLSNLTDYDPVLPPQYIPVRNASSGVYLVSAAMLSTPTVQKQAPLVDPLAGIVLTIFSVIGASFTFCGRSRWMLLKILIPRCCPFNPEAAPLIVREVHGEGETVAMTVQTKLAEEETVDDAFAEKVLVESRASDDFGRAVSFVGSLGARG